MPTKRQPCQPKRQWQLTWSLTGASIGIVTAPNARKARRKAIQPYRKYPGEIYATLLNSGVTSLEVINNVY